MNKKMKTAIALLSKIIPDKTYLIIFVFIRTKKRLNFSNPRTFTDKINFLKLNYTNPLTATLSNKLLVKDFALKYGCMTAKTMWKGTVISQQVWESLPNNFVIKSTHFSGDVVIVKGKENYNLKDINKHFSKILKMDYSLYARENSYKHIDRLVFIEEYLESESGIIPDYKFFCFNGQVEFCHIVEDRFTDLKDFMISKDFINLGFNLDNRSLMETGLPKKPVLYNEMISKAEKISIGFPFVRVDFYEYKESIYLGEMTFYPWGGRYIVLPKQLEKDIENRLGNLIILEDD